MVFRVFLPARSGCGVVRVTGRGVSDRRVLVLSTRSEGPLRVLDLSTRLPGAHGVRGPLVGVLLGAVGVLLAAVQAARREAAWLLVGVRLALVLFGAAVLAGRGVGWMPRAWHQAWCGSVVWPLSAPLPYPAPWRPSWPPCPPSGGRRAVLRSAPAAVLCVVGARQVGATAAVNLAVGLWGWVWGL